MKNIFLKAFLISFPLWLLILQFSPSMGNIWIRPNEYGKKVFVPKNIITYLIEPWKNSYFWNLKMWDINFYMLYLITLGCLYLFSKC